MRKSSVPTTGTTLCNFFQIIPKKVTRKTLCGDFRSNEVFP